MMIVHSKNIVMDKQAERDKIEMMFNSENKELWQIGRILCHELRIDYWVELELNWITDLNKLFPGSYRRIKRVKRYSVMEIQTSSRSMKTVYKIKLEKWKD